MAPPYILDSKTNSKYYFEHAQFHFSDRITYNLWEKTKVEDTDYRMATPEQRAVLHYSEEGHNILITGQCGTGKTFALKYDFHHHIIYI